VIYLRYLIGGAFVYSSIPKIAGRRFTTANGESQPIDTWIHFFETLYRSGIYWNFLGWMQMLAGTLLMTQRFASLGALAFLPVSLNIFVITVSLHFQGTPYVTGLILAANIFLLFWDYRKFKFLFKVDSEENILIPAHYNSFAKNTFWSYLGLVILFTTILAKLFHQISFITWGVACVMEGLGGLLIFLFLIKPKQHFQHF
jgi:hypothetical protein